MTSPSLPVGVKRPLPSIIAASVTRNGTADFCPGEAGRQADFMCLLQPVFAVLEYAEEIVGVSGE